MMAAVSDWILLTFFPIWLDSIVVLIWLHSIFPPDSIWLTSNVFIFNLSHTIQIIFHSGLGYSYIDQGVSEIFQHWNRRIFHNSDNLNWIWLENFNKINK